MKKVLALLVAAVMVFGLAACGSSSSDSTKTETKTEETTTASQTTETSKSTETTETSAETKDTAAASDDKVYELVFQNHDVAGSAHSLYLESWAKEIEEASDGRLKITIYSGGSLGAGTESYDMVINRTADMAAFTLAMYGGRFPITECLALPMNNIKTSKQAGYALNEVWEQGYLDPDFEDVIVLSVFTNSPAVIGTVKEVGNQADSFKGLKLRAASGYITEFATAIGASPMAIPATDIYDSLSKNVIDGYIHDWLGVVAGKLYELSDQIVNYCVSIQPFLTIINKDSYNELPEDLQQILVDHCGLHMTDGESEAWQSNVEAGLKICEEENIPVLELDDETIAEWTDIAMDIHQLWKDNVNEKGYNAEEIYDAFQTAIAKYADL